MELAEHDEIKDVEARILKNGELTLPRAGKLGVPRAFRGARLRSTNPQISSLTVGKGTGGLITDKEALGRNTQSPG